MREGGAALGLFGLFGLLRQLDERGVAGREPPPPCATLADRSVESPLALLAVAASATMHSRQVPDYYWWKRLLATWLN